jgi:hypothetical protein
MDTSSLSEDDYIVALLENTAIFCIIENKTTKICKIAMKLNGYLLRYVENQNDDICKIAIENIPFAIKYCQNKSLELCKLAFQLNLLTYKYFSYYNILELFDTIIFLKIEECIICRQNKEKYVYYSCNSKHIICLDCAFRCEVCYYRCKNSCPSGKVLIYSGDVNNFIIPNMNINSISTLIRIDE